MSMADESPIVAFASSCKLDVDSFCMSGNWPGSTLAPPLASTEDFAE